MDVLAVPESKLETGRPPIMLTVLVVTLTAHVGQGDGGELEVLPFVRPLGKCWRVRPLFDRLLIMRWDRQECGTPYASGIQPKL